MSVGVGALTGAALAATIALVAGGPRALWQDFDLYGYGVRIGASMGMVLGPAASFGFLRHVPLWRGFAETSLGAAVGGLLGFGSDAFFHRIGSGAPITLVGGLRGFIGAAGLLSWRFREARRPTSVSSAG